MNRSAGRLSRHRRGRLAGAVVLLLGLVAAGSLYSLVSTGATSSASASSTSSNDELVSEGRKLFLVSCSSCHGTNGEGIETLNGDQYGPSLAGVGAAAVDFQVGTGRMPMAQPGQQAEAKPAAFTQDEIDALGAYIASLAPGPAVPDESDYSIADLTEEEQQEAIVRGGQIFLTNCTACHNFEGSGGAMPRGGHAPQIRGVEAKYIYEALLTGPQQMPSFSDGNLTPEEKRDVIAYLDSLDTNTGYGGFGMGGFGPVAEGLFAWVVGIGSMVGFAVWIAAHSTRSKRKKATA
ncbi:cytochrome c [Nocardioides sp. BSK12Z-4]|uniref:Cytochrome bc1 complex cytochrome c subunit n=1 Tax=Nocardioides bruguierae TaxID=2945102 RepID=A0A9X2DAY4_9ACTN|nr:cytochrome c [Nocardioides bruguierae]MCL8027053.1 cytochrome c [Nocardioides bruguierae]MCM0622586.1 cytochrome c [Nocardioides bruguierae]